MPQQETDNMVQLGARIPISLKDRLVKYCAGELDGQRHIQEDVVQIALTKHLNMAEKTGKMLKS